MHHFQVEGPGPQARGSTTLVGTYSTAERHKVIRLNLFKSPSVYGDHKNLGSSLSTYFCPQLQIPKELWKRCGQTKQQKMQLDIVLEPEPEWESMSKLPLQLSKTSL